MEGQQREVGQALVADLGTIRYQKLQDSNTP